MLLENTRKGARNCERLSHVIADWPLLVETDLVDQLARLLAMRYDFRQRLVIDLQRAERSDDLVESRALLDRIFVVGLGIDLLGFVGNERIRPT